MFDRFTKVAAAAVLATGLAGAASAQSLGDYNGPYAGLLVGYGAVDLENDGAAGGKDSLTGFDFAGFIGYEVRSDRMYYSGEFEIYETTKENVSGATGLAGVTGLEKDMGYAINGRVGYFLSDGTLIYALAGIEMADFAAEPTGGEEVLGARIGGGAEFRATENISVRSEFIYTIYEDSNFGSGQTIDASDLTFRVGGVYRFQF